MVAMTGGDGVATEHPESLGCMQKPLDAEKKRPAGQDMVKGDPKYDLFRTANKTTFKTKQELRTVSFECLETIRLTIAETFQRRGRCWNLRP